MGEWEALARENAELRRRLEETQRALEALADGDVDSVSRLRASLPSLPPNTEQKLSESSSVLRAVFDGSLDALLVLDDERRVVEANDAACELTGLSREALIGRRAEELGGPSVDVDEQFRAFVARGRAHGRSTLRRADGSTRVIEYTGVASIAAGRHLAVWRDVTERVAAEDALRRSEARFRAMIEKSRDGITLLGPDLRQRYQSPGVERLLGYTSDESRNMDWHEFVDDDQKPKLAAAISDLFAAPGATVSLDFRIRSRDGSPRWLELVATNWLEDPDIGAIVANFRDLTERRALEEELAGFFSLSLDMLSISGHDRMFKRLNPAWETTLGWSLDELYAQPWLAFVHPEDQEATIREGAQLANGQPSVRFENRYRCKDGKYRRLQWSAMPSSSGLVYACARDVTDERVAAERDRLLFSASPLPMLLVDAETLRLLEANDAAVDAYGYARDELLSLGLNDLVAPEQHESVREELALLGRKGIFFEPNRIHRTRSGARKNVEVTSHRIEIEGRPAILKVMVDVTTERRLEAERARHLERLRLLETCISRLNDGVIITRAAPLAEPGPEILYVNEAFTAITGYARDEVIGRSPRFMQGDATDRATLGAVREGLQRAEVVRAELLNYRKDGSPYWNELDIAPVRDDGGALTHFVAVQRDITERRRQEEALRQSEERLRQA